MSSQETVFLFYSYNVRVLPTDAVLDALENMVAQHRSDNLDVGKCNLFERGSNTPLKMAARISDIIGRNSEDNSLELRVVYPVSMFILYSTLSILYRSFIEMLTS